MATNQGNIGLQLDNAKAPCTVNSFASLAQQGYFNDTPCHRLTTSEACRCCSAATRPAQGTGGPGYEFANEYPTNQYQPDDPALQQPVVYPRGTLAMANAGPGTNGSQFFLVYKDSQLPPNYTVFGTIDETGLATLDKIAAAGVAGGGQDGKPATRRPGQVDPAGLTGPSAVDDAAPAVRRVSASRPAPIRRSTTAIRRIRSAIRTRRRATNALAIASLVCAFLFAPLGIVFGHISLSQIKRTGEEGRGLAIAGLVISYLVTVLQSVMALSCCSSWSVASQTSRTWTGQPGLSRLHRARRAVGGPARCRRSSRRPTLGANCQYPATTEPAGKPVKPPRDRHGADRPATVDRQHHHQPRQYRPAAGQRQAPCTVNNFASLAQQGFFDDTPCHRLTTGPTRRAAVR